VTALRAVTLRRIVDTVRRVAPRAIHTSPHHVSSSARWGIRAPGVVQIARASAGFSASGIISP
jgi:hypothetical protein